MNKQEIPMPTSNPMEILLAHDRWATQQILQACEKLTPEQFSKPFDMGPGSLQATTTHILGAMRAWHELLTGKPFGPRLDQTGQKFTPAELLKLHDEIATEFSAQAHARPIEEIVQRDRGGKMYTFTRGSVITHVTTHGMHHRAQCLNMLKSVGVNPLPKSSVVEWTLMIDNPQ
jgi:uncharacterized damage-inducible protein DinB